MRLFSSVALILSAGLTSGCLSTAAAVVKAPFQAAGQTADWLTTSQDEADRNRGREVRKQEAREARDRRKHDAEIAREAKRQRDD